jgi:hypothetical protein
MSIINNCECLMSRADRYLTQLPNCRLLSVQDLFERLKTVGKGEQGDLPVFIQRNFQLVSAVSGSGNVLFRNSCVVGLNLLRTC